MGVRSASDLFYVSLVRLPLLALMLAIAWILLSGMAELEAISFGTEWFVGNDETANRFTPLGGATDEELLLDAANTGDPAQMQAALDRYEAQQAALASR